MIDYVAVHWILLYCCVYGPLSSFDIAFISLSESRDHSKRRCTIQYNTKDKHKIKQNCLGEL